MSRSLCERGLFMSAALRVATAVAVFSLASCGGGGGGGGDASPPTVSAQAQQCAPSNPYMADASAPTTVGSLSTEKSWMHAYVDQAYLWYGEMPNVDPNAAAYSNTSTGAATYTSLDNYFEALKSPTLTASGNKRDKFSFTYPTKAWKDLSQGGVESGYGIQWHAQSWNSTPRGVRIAFIEPGSPAATGGLLRGDQLVTVDGVSVDTMTSAGIDTINAGMFPKATGSVHRLVVSRAGSTVTVDLTSATVTKHPVPNYWVKTIGDKNVGYILFNDHMGTAEADLITAVNALKAAGVDDLVLDLRYNGGGYLYMASELAYMIAGSVRTNGKVFEQLQFNDKRSADTNSADAKTPFFSQSFYYDANFKPTRVEALPTLNLSRVAVLTSADTCSASEAVINGLRGVDVDVRLIGSTTCGKPYGFTAKDNCGISYFPIEFKGVNAKGFGDYSDGFNANCPASDDFNHALGDVAENQLSAALYNLANNSCNPAVSSNHARAMSAGKGVVGRLLRGAERESSILVPTGR